MFDMSWGEVMVIGVVALIVIGPKDLPKALRTVGNVTGKLRRMAAEFHGQFNDAMREAELDEIKKQVTDINQSVGSLDRGFNPVQTIRDELKGAVDSAGATSDRPRAESGSPLATADTTAQRSVEAPDVTVPLPPAFPGSDPAELGRIPVEPPVHSGSSEHPASTNDQPSRKTE